MHLEHRRAKRLVLGAALVAASLVAVACGTDGNAASSGVTTTAAIASSSTTPLEGRITVSAAASLTEVFGTLGKQFERDHPRATVAFNFDSSATLATQIQAGAPADVFASADTSTMDGLDAAGLLDAASVPFAHNSLTIVVKPGNPEHVKSVRDLSTVGVVALCAVTAPCGKYADQVLTATHVVLASDHITRGQNAKATLAAVAQGDADAGIVYGSDAHGNATVDAIAIPAADNVVATYPIAVLAATSNARLAHAFADYVRSSEGRMALKAAGFGVT